MAGQPVSAMDVAADGWRLALRAIVSLPRLFASGLLVLVLWELASTHILMLQQVSKLPSISYFASLPGSIVNTLVFASIAVAVHRLVIIHEVLDRPIWRVQAIYGTFVVWSFGFFVLGDLPGAIWRVIGLKNPAWFLTINFLYAICYSFVCLRLTLIFPAIAVASPHAGWRNAWNASRGHLWKFFWAGFWALLPIGIVVLIAVVVIGATVGLGAPSANWVEPLALGVDAESLLSSAVVAAVASRFFQIYDNGRLPITGPAVPSAPSS